MKRIILALIIALAFGSCMTTKRAFVNTYARDLLKYQNEGVLVYPVSSSETEYKEYFPIAVIGIEAGWGINENGDYFDPTPEYMFDLLVYEAKKRGANCIFDAEIETNSNDREEGSPRYIVKGFAVKLKNFPQE